MSPLKYFLLFLLNFFILSQASGQIYLIGEFLGEGSYGRIYKATELSTGKIVAQKYISVGGTEWKRTVREGIFLMELSHPNIVKGKEILKGTYPNQIIFVMDYYTCNLRQLIKKVPLDLEYRRHVMHQILQGVYYLHRMKIVHRDLKLDNLLVRNLGTANPEIGIADLGAAKYIQDFSLRTSGERGTSWYMAPNTNIGEETKFKDDIWSLGMVLGELITRNPDSYWKTSWEELKGLKPAEARVKIKARYPSADDQEIDLMEKMLRVDPNERISARRGLRHPYFKGWSVHRGNSVDLRSRFDYEKEEGHLEAEKAFEILML